MIGNRKFEHIEIAGADVGNGYPCFIIAEAGVNHNGSRSLAMELVDAAAKAGANAVKFQTFHSGDLAVPSAPKAQYQKSNCGEGENQLEMLKKLELPDDAWQEIKEYATRRNIVFLSTPFDNQSAKLLYDLEMPAFKIASGEITNMPFLRYVAGFGIPVILSTGMSSLSDVQGAVSEIQRAGNNRIVLLHCVSNYPARPEDVNLKAMRTLADMFSLPVGFSDHTEGNEIAIAAVAMGACIIEKHLTTDLNLPGPDHKASQTPSNFAALVRGIRIVESAMGDGKKEPKASEKDVSTVVRRSLVAARDIRPGTKLSMDDIEIKRPGFGIPPSMLNAVLGREIKVSITAGTLFSLEMIQ